ncbi:MAG: hypothetical protein J6Q32_00685 [Clostridia bacterium]|nr:hypothetical protein [Clostridia bacterium]
MNVLCGIIAICLCTFIGYYLSGRWTDRKIFYSDFLSFHNTLLKEIEFSKKSLPEIAETLSNDKDFNKYVKNIYFNEQGKILKFKYLTADENKFLEDYFLKIGKSNSQVENGFLNSLTDEIINKSSQSAVNEVKYKKLYIKIGFLLGLMLFILLI